MKNLFKLAGLLTTVTLLAFASCKKPDNTTPPVSPPTETNCSTGYTKVNGKCLVDTGNFFKDEWGSVQPRWMKDSLWWSTNKCNNFDTSYIYIKTWNPANPSVRDGWTASKIEGDYEPNLAIGTHCYWPDPVRGDSVEWDMPFISPFRAIFNGRFNLAQDSLKGILRYQSFIVGDTRTPPAPCGPILFRKVKEVFD